MHHLCIILILHLLRCSTARVNPIIAENALPGSPVSDWDVNGVGDSSIQGFTDDISYQIPWSDSSTVTVQFKISTPATSWRLDIFRLGYYGGLGARRVATIHPRYKDIALSNVQAPCVLEPDTHLVDCAAWHSVAYWKVPRNATSGLYFGRPTRTDKESERAGNWRADRSEKHFDRTHMRPGVDPYHEPQPEPLLHAYGAAGHGLLRQGFALRNPRASHIWFVLKEPMPESGHDLEASTGTTGRWHGSGATASAQASSN